MIEVTYEHHGGTDLATVNSARVSFNKRSDELSKKDAKLVSYLSEHKHTSPFNHAYATFTVKAPIFVARQLVKHEYLPWNEVSRRYVDDEPEFYVPDVWRGVVLTRSKALRV
jgi:thymidylate synthase (FAD)